MQKNLVIVESPAKAKTIEKFLGKDFKVLSSYGHIRDLKKKEFSIDVDKDFKPHYEIPADKKKIVTQLKEEAEQAETVWLASDEDREGEAIAWHLYEVLKLKPEHTRRIVFHEITKGAILKAIENPRDIDINLVDAQQARRILDRIVGFELSPVLWKKVKPALSAGRVQSVAVRLIVEREREIHAFQTEASYRVTAVFLVPDTDGKTVEMKAELAHRLKTKAEARKLLESCKAATFTISDITTRPLKKTPAAPFTTSTLQQEAARKLGFTVAQTMMVAQRLYESGLITYMRTDSVRIADEAPKAAADFIENRFGKDYLAPGGKRNFKTKSDAQDAHEAIRPVDVTLTPEDVKPYLAPDQYQVYRLIWARFVASQMAAARFHDTTVTIDNGPVQWRSKGERMLFPGFLAVMPRGKDEEGVELPALTKGETLKLNSLTKEQKFTQPSPRFTEASLVREREALGIGRPSTYASIISTLQDRDYVTLEEKHFAPTDLGRVVCDRLREHFKTLMDVGFTAHMEELLDKVAEGQQDWVALLRNFNNDFDPTLLEAAKSMGKAKTDTVTDIPCPECGKPLAVKFGKTGQFLACTGYPACRYTSNYTRDEQGQIHLQEKVKPEFEKVGTCPECGKDLVLKRSRTGSRFIACSGYPDCKHAEPYSTGVPCPREGCNGVLVEKSSKRGKIFYSCSNYPQCDYALWDWPIAEPCPECGSPLLVLKNTKAKGKFIACPEKTCKYTRPLEGGSEDDAE